MRGNVEGKEQLRKADIMTGIILVVLGIAVMLGAFTMPMHASYGGVQNVWYVSPALFPLIVSAGIIILGATLAINGWRSVGTKKAIATIAKGVGGIKALKRLSPPMFRVFGIVLILIFYVYLYIPNIDFFLSTLLLLSVFITSYYYDQDALTRKMVKTFIYGSLFFAIYIVTGLAGIVEDLFSYTTDIIALIFIVFFIVYSKVLAGGNTDLQRRFRISLTTALVVPLLLCPVFKYFLLVPLPKEGGIIKLMDYIRYSVF